MGKGYPKKGGGARATERSRAVGAVGGKLEEIAREGAQRLLAEMLELEVDESSCSARVTSAGWPPCIRGSAATATDTPRRGCWAPGWVR